MIAIGKVSRVLLGDPSVRAVFDRPGFAPEAWKRFGPVGLSLVEGYHATLESSRTERLVPRLDEVAPELRGFAYEGAGMGLAALDLAAPWRDRVQEFVEGPGAAHIFPVYVGVGLALARLRRRPEPRLARMDPLLGWAAIDGYGFHQAFFARRRHVDAQVVPRHLSDYGRRIFDQGVGRAIWFSCGAVVDLVASTIADFPTTRHADLWIGVGMACGFGGGADRAGLHAVATHAAGYRAELARGAATAAWGRELAGSRPGYTDLTCEVFCGTTAVEAARALERARQNVSAHRAEPAYELWRRCGWNS